MIFDVTKKQLMEKLNYSPPSPPPPLPLFSSGTKPESINKQIWMKKLSRNSAQRYQIHTIVKIHFSLVPSV